jgi:inner membrane protein
MLARTHLVITLFIVLLFFSSEQNFALFLFVSLFATLLPDIDTPYSKIGKHKLFRIINFFTKHRGIIHSFTFLFAVSVILLIFFKEILIPFVLGYASHLLADCFTIQGVRLFYPFKLKIRGKLRTNGLIENLLFVIFGFMDFFLAFNYFFNVF